MVRKAERKDLWIVAELAVLLWESYSIQELIQSFSDAYESKKTCFFLKTENDIPIGFAQCQLQYDYVEGTESTPVGYLEGIFIKEAYRNKGFAAELLSECETWAKKNGCREFASDCELDNTDSFLFHKAVGFSETNRIICFKKGL